MICLDYDGTFTKYPDLCNLIIDYCKKKNIECILATMRSEKERDDGLAEIEKKIKVYYTNRKAKALFLAELQIYPDVYIDDNPMWLYKDG